MLDELIQERFKKLARLKKAGINPYPARVPRTFEIGYVIGDFDRLEREYGEKTQKVLSVAGRIMSIRDQGKIIFADIVDESGKIQIVLNRGFLGEKFVLWQSVLDIGDFVSATGTLFKTKKGEMSVDVHELAVAAKGLLPLPDKRGGLENEEIRLRKRYLDLLATPELRELFRKKNLFWQSFREHLAREGFLEVETPVFEALPGGAEAEPFRTHHNALDVDLYLRISLELPLKKLLIAGYEKVFEIGRIFRNEGIDREHLQDYTQLEFYWAYHDYRDLTDFVEKMYKSAIKNVCGTLKTSFGGNAIDWGRKWPVIEYADVFKKYANLDPIAASREELFKKAVSLALKPESHSGKGRLVDLIFKKTARPALVQPSFLVNPPVEVEPLAKRSDKNPALVERMQVMACGTELGKGFSELNDPIDQRARFEEQMKLREAGDVEAQRLDEEFLEALEYGMPPAAGFGVSERLFAVLMDKPVRETTIFPLMRPKE